MTLSIPKSLHSVVACSIIYGAGGLVGCASSQKTEANSYSISAPDGDWVRQKPGSANYAWTSKSLSATIYSDANCGARYEDGELGALIDHLVFGIAVDVPILEETLTISNRDALLRTYDGKIDGVQVKIGAMVAKKHDCLYDVLYIAPRDQFSNGWNQYRATASGIQIK